MAASSITLNDVEQGRIAALREAVRDQIPGAIPFIRALHQEGMIPGWRSVYYVGPPRTIPGAVRGPFLHGDEFIEAVAAAGKQEPRS